MFAGGDADVAGGPIAHFTQRVQLAFNLRKARADAVEQPFTGLGGGDAAGGAGEQAQRQAFFQPANSVAERRLGNPKLRRRFGEAALPGHHQESDQIVKVFFQHIGTEEEGERTVAQIYEFSS